MKALVVITPFIISFWFRRFYKYTAALILPGVIAQSTTKRSSSPTTPLSIHGSGSENPAQCYWTIFNRLEMQSKLPIKMTYRAVGTSTGQVEFFGDRSVPDNDFGSGDMPLNEGVFEIFPSGSIVHFPILLKPFGFFHSLPIIRGVVGNDDDDDEDQKQLFLNSCVLAKIFRRDIVEWGDKEIISLNPTLKNFLAGGDVLPITVVRPAGATSSTGLITEYLQKSCPEFWSESLVGAIIDWHNDTLACDDSSASTTMIDCILNTPGSIGYVDSSVATPFLHSEDTTTTVKEVALQNLDGEFLTSQESAERGGILAATENAGIPDSFDSTFANVDLLNQPGPFTWPIVSMTYLYVRKDLTFLTIPEEQTLLKAFLKAMYFDEYISACGTEMGYFPITGSVRDRALEMIDSLVVSTDAPEWVFEFNTERRVGQGNFVFSSKRRNYNNVIQNILVHSVESLEQQLATLELKFTGTNQTVEQNPNNGSTTTGGGGDNDVITIEEAFDTLQQQTNDLMSQVMSMAKLIEDLSSGLANVTAQNEALTRRLEVLEDFVQARSSSDSSGGGGSMRLKGWTMGVYWIRAAAAFGFLYFYYALL